MEFIIWYVPVTKLCMKRTLKGKTLAHSTVAVSISIDCSIQCTSIINNCFNFMLTLYQEFANQNCTNALQSANK